MSFDAIGIVAKDPARSVAFYALLGITLKQMPGTEHYEATTPGGVRIMLDSEAVIRSFITDWEKPTGSGIVMCFKQSSAAEVDRLYDLLVAKGAHAKKTPWDAFWGQRYACVLDPDGNRIDLFANAK